LSEGDRRQRSGDADKAAGGEGGVSKKASAFHLLLRIHGRPTKITEKNSLFTSSVCCPEKSLSNRSDGPAEAGHYVHAAG
jgi:hypothetical protein